MTWRDKLEIGLKDDAPYRKDNLPESQIRGRRVFRYSASATLWLTWRPTARGATRGRSMMKMQP